MLQEQDTKVILYYGKELLAIYVFVLKFKYYLIGNQFIVGTDHQALKWYWNSPNTSEYCIWMAKLEIFYMWVGFRKSNEHINVDTVSRLPPFEQCLINHTYSKREEMSNSIQIKPNNKELAFRENGKWVKLLKLLATRKVRISKS